MMTSCRDTWVRVLAVAAVAVLATGCFQMQDQLTVNKDGSGSWKYKLVLNPQLTAMMAQAEAGDGQGVTMRDNDEMPPVRREQLEALVAKAEGAEIKGFSRQVKDGSTIIGAQVDFSSVEKVMNSPLGEKIGWHLAKDGNELVATAPPLMNNESKGDGNMQLENQFGMAKGMMQGLRVNRRLSLPTAPTGGNAHGAKANLAAWDFRMTTDTTEAQFKKASTEKPEYRTSAAGIAFKLPLGPKPAAVKETKEVAIEAGEPVAGNRQVKPLSAKMTRRVNYEKANVFFGDTPLEIELRVPHADADSLIGYTGPFLSKAVDNQGTDLKPKKHGFHKPEDLKDVRTFTHHNEAAKGFSLTLNLEEPARTAGTCTITGHLIIHSPGETKTIELDNLAGQVGKQLANPDDLWIKLEEVEDQSVRLRARGEWVKSIQEVEGYDANGKKLERTSTSRGGFNNEVVLYYGFDGGTPARLVLSVATTINKEKVDFSLVDLKLP